MAFWHSTGQPENIVAQNEIYVVPINKCRRFTPVHSPPNILTPHLVCSLVFLDVQLLASSSTSWVVNRPLWAVGRALVAKTVDVDGCGDGGFSVAGVGAGTSVGATTGTASPVDWPWTSWAGPTSSLPMSTSPSSITRSNWEALTSWCLKATYLHSASMSSR